MKHFQNVTRIGSALLTAFGIVIVLSLVGCGSGSSSGGGSGTPTPFPTGTGRLVEQPGWRVNTPTYQQLPKKWTFLVFMNGANDLEEFGSLNMNQMEQFGSTDQVNLVVQFKRFAGRFDRSNGDWGDTRRFYVTKDNNTSVVSSAPLSQHDNKDMGDWQSLREFIQWGVETYPAEKYCLVIWNHGAGWRKVNTNQAATKRGVSYDDTTNNHIDTIELPQAIDLAPFLGNNRKWDVLAFDASLMQMIEVAHEIRDEALYIVGSEESPPGEGYPYQLFMDDLTGNPNISPRDFAIKMAESTILGYGQDSNITHSVLDTSRVAAVTAAMNELGGSLLAVKDTYRDQIVFARQNAENYDYPYYRDILDFISLLTTPLPGATQPPVPDMAVQSAANRVRSAVQAAVIFNVNGSFHPRSQGLSVFLPSPQQYNSLDIDQANGFGQRYGALTYAKDAPLWQSFLVNGPR
ncbi:MAG: hypothetical protein OHK0029_37750 [Armatimonadaceae bacterium]